MKERWRPFREGMYEASSLGNIRRAMPGIATFIGRPLHPSVGATGYPQVGLSEPGMGRKQRKLYVHRVIIETFLGPCPSCMLVNHKNGNRLDNRLSNLEYVTFGDNVRHAREKLPRHIGPKMTPRPLKGRQSGDSHWSRRMPERVARGEKMGASKLTIKNVRHIKKMASSGPRGTQTRLASEFGMSVAQISRIVRGTRWGHIK